ncbi:MAG: glutamate 5-kinase [Clostridia bacterium]|nr:glutamate 5-kinase [Clostridia bacterium]
MSNFQNIKRLVVKVGTSTLTYETGKLNIRRMVKLCSVLSDLHNSGIDVALVTSGAIGVGVGKLGLSEKPHDIPGRQAAATVGQCELMFMYDKFFSEYGQKVGQLLVTKSDFENIERRTNLTNTFEKLFEYGAIPVINENDSVATEEIVFGDNDSLSAIVAELIKADGLVILTDIEGLFDSNPAENPEARLIPFVDQIDESIEALCGGAGTNRGTGGMITKIHAAKIATDASITTVIMSGADPSDLYKLIDGRQIGTTFKAK